MGDQDEKKEKDENAQRWAADEPTAMWNDSDLADSGYQQLVVDRASKPREATGPATQREVRGDSGTAVQVSRDATGGHPASTAVAKPRAGTGALTWVLTIALALGVGTLVYLVIRLARG